jgi:outer membrane lipoprotein-sorting protein
LIIINNGKVTFKAQNQSAGSISKENKLMDQLNALVNSAFNGGIGQDKNFTTSLYENSGFYKVLFLPNKAELKNLFKMIIIYFNKSSLDITSTQIVEISNDSTTISFSNQIFNKPISESEFRTN